VLSTELEEDWMFTRNAGAWCLVAGLTSALTLVAKDWTAAIGPVGNSMVSGTATATEVAGDSLAVTLSIVGAKAGDEHPWHVHTGGCDNSGAVLGEASRYAPLRVGADNKASGTARVRVRLMPGSAYSVNVHRSPADQTAIACGDLRQSAR
jgi:hypothetical protein